MITADQIIVHLIGDYIAQSHWMASEKTKAHLPAFLHALTYSLLFLVFRPSLFAWIVIFGSHFLIDRYRLARYIVWLKNFGAPTSRPWSECSSTGYPADVPAWLSVWLLIIADNVLHLLVNGLCLRYL